MRQRLRFAHKIAAMPLLAVVAILLIVAAVQVNSASTIRSVTARTRDEVGEISDALNTALERLRRALAALGHHATSLVAAAEIAESVSWLAQATQSTASGGDATESSARELANMAAELQRSSSSFRYEAR